jgi:hypothetical protein
MMVGTYAEFWIRVHICQRFQEAFEWPVNELDKKTSGLNAGGDLIGGVLCTCFLPQREEILDGEVRTYR